MLRANRQNRDDIRKAREEWTEKSNGRQIERLVFIDESEAMTNMTRLRGVGDRKDLSQHGGYAGMTRLHESTDKTLALPREGIKDTERGDPDRIPLCVTADDARF